MATQRAGRSEESIGWRWSGVRPLRRQSGQAARPPIEREALPKASILLFRRFGLRLLCRFLVRGGFFRPLGQSIEEWERGMWRLYLARQRRTKRHHAAIELAGGILVLLDDRAGETDAREYSSSARVSKHLPSHLPGRIRGRMASHRASSHRCVCAQLKFAGEKFLRAVLVHDQHYEIDRLSADLDPDTAAAGEQECGRTPTFLSPATGHSAAVVGRHDEPAFQQRGNDRHALRRA